MAKQIYRKALLERMSSPEQLDKMIVITSPSFWLALLGGTAIVVVALIWSIFGRLPINLETSGIFVSDQMAFTLSSDTGGIVSSLEVEVGDYVEAGDVLLTLADEDVQRELSALLDRRAKVEAVTLTSVNDEVTVDNRDLINLKTQLGSTGSEIEQNQAMLAVYRSELAALRPQVSAAQAEMEAARKEYYAYIQSDTDSQIEIEFSEAQASYNQQVSLLASAEANLKGTWSNYYNTVDSLKMSLSQSLASAITDAEQKLSTAETNLESYEDSYDLTEDGLDSLYDQRDELEDNLDEYEDLLEKAKSEMNSISQGCAKWKQEITSKNAQIEKLNAEVAALKTQQESGGDSGVDDGGANTPSLKEQIEAKLKEIEARNAEVQALGTQITAAEEQYALLQGEVQNKISPAISSLEQSLDQVNSNITSIKKELISLKNQVEGMQDTVDSLESAISKYEKGQSILRGISSTTPPEGFHTLVKNGVLESNSYSSIQNIYSQCQTAQKAYDDTKLEHDSAMAKYEEMKVEYSAYMNGRAENNAEKERLGTLYNQLNSEYNALYSQQTSLEANITSLEGQLRASSVGSEVQSQGYMEQFESTKSAVLDSLDAEIEKYQYNLEKTNIRAKVSGNVTDIKVGIGAAVGQGTEIVTVRQLSEENHIICYIPISSGKKVEAGMEVIVSPTTVNRQEYGHMKAEVVAVDSYVTPASSIRAMLGDELLAQAFTQNGPVVAVTCRLYTDDTTASGYWWSNRKGADLIVPEGTMVVADIVTEKKVPITMLIPYIKEKLSMAVEPGINGKEGQ